MRQLSSRCTRPLSSFTLTSRHCLAAARDHSRHYLQTISRPTALKCWEPYFAMVTSDKGVHKGRPPTGQYSVGRDNPCGVEFHAHFAPLFGRIGWCSPGSGATPRIFRRRFLFRPRLNQYQGGMCISGVRRRPQRLLGSSYHLKSPTGLPPTLRSSNMHIPP